MAVQAMQAGESRPGNVAGQWSSWTAGICILIGAVFGLALVGTQAGLLSDEGFHGAQIWHMYAGNWEILDNITMIPTYHAVLALVAQALHFYHDQMHRTVTLVGALSLPWIGWYMLVRQMPAEAGRRVLQLWYFPLLFPFYFMMYTDAWAAAAVLATAMCALSGRLLWAGVAGAIAFVLRQDTIIWSALMLWLVMLDGVKLEHWRAMLRRLLLNTLCKAWPLLLLLGVVVAFVIWNKGVAVGDRSFHQEGVNPGNIYSFLIWSWVIFLPHNLQAVPRILDLMARRPAVVLMLLAGFLLYMGTYTNPHPYNQEHLRWWLHNELLYWLTQSFTFRVLAFLPVAWMVLTACVTRMPDARLNWLYPAAIASAAMHPLIEPRYYVPALLLFVLWRPLMSERWENFALIYGILMSAFMLFGSVTRLFFI
ncbi:hypothetical protein HJ583_010580 [Uliginosibacterium sp. IMCC34675]|uniref:Uncharacterized protein n=1 Tax=Uliginosibacterium aquaticum TaxID=2731212 RepID=A0ABX2IMW9_9RHOO|nr:hypothetical protein [Uliginosibacterium aquaticum]